MATAQTLIDRALRLIGQIGAGASPSSDESADALEALNDLIDDWRNEGLMCFALQEESLTLANADASYTIGATGDLATTRPVAIERAWIVDDDVSHPVRLITEQEYADIPAKTTAGDWPDRALYRPSITSDRGTLIVYPVPNATRTLKLLTRVPLAELAAVGTTVTLPPGYRKALIANLALEIAPEYQTSPSDEVVKMARESKANIKRINARPILAGNELGLMFGRGSSNILSGP